MALETHHPTNTRSELTVLVLDDEPFMLKLIARMLDIEGFEHVKTCLSARAALEAAADKTHPIDLIIFDLNMPEMDGIEFVRGLVERQYVGSLILVSGADDRVLRAAQKLIEAHSINVLGYLRKPLFSESLAALLKKWSRPRGGANRSETLRDHREVQAAIANGELVNYYQPKVDLATGQVVGVETLVRWNHPIDGLVMPDQFIRLAEENGFIDDLTRVVTLSALHQVRTWAETGLNLQVAINVSMENLNQLDFPDFFAELSARLGVAPNAVVIEVTESRLMQDPRAPLEVLTRLRLKGFLLSIDDFGTGHSSLVQLQNLPFDELKVDRGFVHHAWRDPTTLAIYHASLGLATQLNMEIVAEGVEDQADWDFLRRTKCGLAQGYFIGRPMPAAEVIPWTETWKRRCGDELYAVASANVSSAALGAYSPNDFAVANADLAISQPLAPESLGLKDPASPETNLSDLADLTLPILDALPQRLCILDETGLIIAVNAAWSAYQAANATDTLSVGVGVNYLDICDKAVGDTGAAAHECAAGTRAILSRRRESFSFEYPCPSQDRWYLCDARKLANAHVERVVVSYSDITERMLAQINSLNSEQRFRDLADLSADAYWETDEEHRFTLTSWRWDSPDRVEHSEWITAGILGKARWEVPFLEASPEQWRQHRSDLKRRRTFRNLEIKRTHESSETRYFSVAGRPVFNSAGRFQGYRGVSRDITERRQAQDRIEYLNRVYSVLSGINTLIVRAADRNILFTEACRIAVDAGGFKAAVLGVVNKKSMLIDLVASAGADPDHIAGLLPRMSMRDDAPFGQNPAVQAVKTRVAIVINDSSRDERVVLKKAHAQRGIRSMVSLPIIVGNGEVVAIFNLYAAELGFFDDAEMRLLGELAGDIAYAIENFSKHQRLAYLKRVADFASGINALIVRATDRKELFKDACEVAVDKGGFPMALLGILDITGTEVALGGLAGKNQDALEFTRKLLSGGSVPPNLMVAQAIKERAPVISNDSQNDSRVAYGSMHVEFDGRSLAIFPVVVSDLVIAVLALYAEERDFFHEEEIKLLKELIGNIAFAVDRLDKVARPVNASIPVWQPDDMT